MLAFYLFEVCVGLKDFYQLRADMLPLERKTLEMRPHFQVGKERRRNKWD